jgi:hypothetical protein
LALVTSVVLPPDATDRPDVAVSTTRLSPWCMLGVSGVLRALELPPFVAELSSESTGVVTSVVPVIPALDGFEKPGDCRVLDEPEGL